jgi:hypothetical protein
MDNGEEEVEIYLPIHPHYEKTKCQNMVVLMINLMGARV